MRVRIHPRQLSWADCTELLPINTVKRVQYAYLLHTPHPHWILLHTPHPHWILLHTPHPHWILLHTHTTPTLDSPTHTTPTLDSPSTYTLCTPPTTHIPGHLTRVCTMNTLCRRMWVRNSYTLTVLSDMILSSMESRRMKAPVRPTPALQCTTMADCSWWCCRSLRMKLMRAVANWGTPWSGQLRNWKWCTSSGGALDFPACRTCRSGR